jgi:hypothetical protein
MDRQRSGLRQDAFIYMPKKGDAALKKMESSF